MSRFSLFVCGLCVAAFASIGSHAQQSADTAIEAPRFTGFYGGMGGGFGDFSAGGSGGYFELFAGLRNQTSSGLVYGIEAQGAIIDTDEPSTFVDISDGYGSILAKVGYTPNNRVMWYGGAGYTSVEVENEDANNGSSDGIAFEAGVEYMPTTWFGLRLRGQYHAVSGESDISTIGAAILFSF